jgi:hypothetical protein
MSAPDLETLLDHETQIESAIVTLLQAQKIPAVRTDGNETLETPRVEVVATVGPQGMHQAVISSGTLANARVYDMFAVGVDVSLVVDLSAGQPVQNLRGLLRKAIIYITPANLNAQLTYLTVAEESVRQTSGTRAAEDSGKVIRLTCGLTLIAAIKSSAWPA